MLIPISMAAANFKDHLLAGLGGAWPEPCPLKPKVEKTEQKDGYRLETISYEAEPDDRIPALLLIPDGVTKDKTAPAICIWHQHGAQWHLGKSEPAGLAGDAMNHTGAALAREGYVVLCPDALGFEEREKGYKLKGRDLERYLFLQYVVSGKCMAWKNILDMRRGVKVIEGAYESMHAEGNFSYYIEKDTGHVLSDEMWRRTKAFFKNHLS